MRVSTIALLVVAMGAVAVLAETPVLFRRDPVSVEEWTDISMPTGTPRPQWSNVAPDSVTALQSADSVPTVYIDPEDDVGLAYTTRIFVNTTNDNDYIGVVVGFGEGGFTDPNANYVLIDWKQGEENGAPAGLAAWQIRGAVNAQQLRTHTGTQIRPLGRGRTLGSTGWEDNTNHTIAVIITSNRLIVRVDGVVQLDVGPATAPPGFPGGFSNEGSFGFYCFSQEAVEYTLLGREPVLSGTSGRQVNFLRRFRNNDDNPEDGYSLFVDWGDDSPDESYSTPSPAIELVEEREGGFVRVQHVYTNDRDDGNDAVFRASFRLVNEGSDNEDIFFAVFVITPPADVVDPTVDECDPVNIQTVVVERDQAGAAFAASDARCLCIRVE